MTTTTHYLDFICEGWVGNFELDLVSYVFNAPDYDHPERDFSTRLTEEEREEAERIFGEEFLEWNYGEYGLTNVELGHADHPVTGEERSTVRVEISDDNWGRVMDAQTIELIKQRAEKFFTLYRAGLPSYQLQEGAFVGLLHTTVTRDEVSALL